MLDFNRPSVKLGNAGDKIVARIDAALEAANAASGSRDYLGASAIGDPCARKIQYQYRDPAPHFDGRILRIFERGHAGEERAIKWLRAAGFMLKTHKDNGRQIGFISGQGKYRGHIDGTLLESPIAEVSTPALWECKFINAKGFANVKSKGVELAYPAYYAQISQYMAYLDLTANPAMFFAVNADTQHIYVEMIPFDAKVAQATTDKAVNILLAEQAGEQLPRPYASPDNFRCRFCSYSDQCWEGF